MRTQFLEHGYVRLAGAFSVDVAAALADEVWAELERRHGMTRRDRATWTTIQPSGLGGLRKRKVFDALATPAAVAAISELLGTDTWPAPFSWGDPLVTMPAPGRWAVPDTGWHIDFPARSHLRLKWLAYLAAVLPGGGGTVVLAGSHRTVERFLRDNPRNPGRSAGIRQTVLAAGLRNAVELTGEPGDMVFLHPHLFHASAPNHSTAPRLMATGGLAWGPGHTRPEVPVEQ
jgi:hypothetical protein